MIRRRILLQIACAMVAVTWRSTPWAQSLPGPDADRFVPAAGAPAPVGGQVLQAAPYAAGARVRYIELKPERHSLPADGQSADVIEVTLRDGDHALVDVPVVVTIEVSGDSARVQLAGAATDETGIRRGDQDRLVRGTQLSIEHGRALITLLAPSHPQDVTVRVSAGSAVAAEVISCETEARRMIAAGLIEGVVHISGHSPITVNPANLDDGFEQQLSLWSRSFNGGKDDVAMRGALFLKGTISGDALLTASYDSDKFTPARLLQDIQPDQFYPVYGDSSIQGFDAQSTSRLYVRVDEKRSFLLYGDFVTGSGFAAQAQGGTVADNRLMLLGAYNRTLTGAEAHYESARGYVTGFASRDTLKQAVEEYRANGTSGPFTIHNTSALENSEKVEIIVRDKNQLNLIISDTTLQRYVDYSFEPFAGAILFNAPVPSLDPQGNPESIRITYEVDQGGPLFWLFGANGEYNVGSRLTVGGSYVNDRNPTSPFELESLNAQARLGHNTTLTMEAAQTSATTYEVNGQTYTNPTGEAGEVVDDATGRAERVHLTHTDDQFKADVWGIIADNEFNNPSSGITPGEQQFGERSSLVLDPRWTLHSEAIRTEDTVADATQSGGVVDLNYAWNKNLKLLAGVRYADEHGLVGSQSFIGANPSPGSLFNPSSGFDGGINSAELNPLTGQPATQNLTPSVPGQSVGTQSGVPLDGTYLFAGAQWKPLPRLTGDARVEESVAGDGGQILEAGLSWQVAERTRLYLRDQDQTGLSSDYSLNGSEATRAIVAGVDTTFLQDTNASAAAYSEYRLQDAVSGTQYQDATGLRNTWALMPGLNLRSSVEYLEVYSSTAPGAESATLGLDYTANPLWKASARVEWRKLFDTPGTVGNDGQTSTLTTLSLARKLSRDWTLLTRDYYLIQNNHTDSTGEPIANAWQNRYQLGAAYRPVDDNRFDALFRYEYKEEQNILGDAAGVTEHVAAVVGNWHPSRPWWVSTRLAAQAERDVFAQIEGGGHSSYTAWLAGGRVLYDVSKRWDVGVQSYVLRSDTGSAEQYAVGVEFGRLMMENLWLSLGYDFSGFSAKDMAGSDYTQPGIYLRLRWKFTQDLLKGDDPEFNRSLDR